MKKAVALGMILLSGLMQTSSFALPVWLTHEENPYTVMFRNRQFYDSEAKSKSGEISINQSEFQYSEEFKVKEKLPLTFTATLRHTEINEDLSQIELPAHLVARSLLFGAKFPAPFVDSETLFMGIDLIPTLNTDSWDEAPSGSFRLPFRTYLIYKKNDNFIWVGGLSIRPNYDTSVLPIIGFIWKPNEQLSFNFASDNPYIAYKLDEKITLIWEASLIADEYEVTRNNQKGVVLKYNEVSTGLGFEYKLNSMFTVVASTGVALSRRLEYKDDNGKVVPEDGFYTSLKLTAQF